MLHRPRCHILHVLSPRLRRRCQQCPGRSRRVLGHSIGMQRRLLQVRLFRMLACFVMAFLLCHGLDNLEQGGRGGCTGSMDRDWSHVPVLRAWSGRASRLSEPSLRAAVGHEERCQELLSRQGWGWRSWLPSCLHHGSRGHELLVFGYQVEG